MGSVFLSHSAATAEQQSVTCPGCIPVSYLMTAGICDPPMIQIRNEHKMEGCQILAFGILALNRVLKLQ